MTAESEPRYRPGAYRRFLRAQAHHLRPLVHVGKHGLTPAVLAAIEEALAHHELIKVRFLTDRAQQRALAEAIARASRSEIVGRVGRIVIFYRQHPDPARRTIHLPATVWRAAPPGDPGLQRDDAG
ncbi:MAG: hypothetical protein KatS3mg131_1587 [Candidatus Tectimicrobiota bacterium]|nr:MAG: hypothetical protein KatS3mg131_1587 [Candidatus Tectomicrobia bacterium]